MTNPSLPNLTPESFLADLLSPFTLTQLLHSMQSLISPLLSPKDPGFPFFLRLQEFMSFKCSHHSAFPSICALSLLQDWSSSFPPFPLQTCCTPDTPAGRRIFNSHPWLREVLLLFTPESIPATTHKVPKLSPHSNMYTAALMLFSHRPSD